MKILQYILFFLITLTHAQYGYSAEKFDYTAFGEIPVLNEGRVKPLDTFARVNLLLFYEKSALKEMPAIEWLAELIFANDDAFERDIFRIRNKDVTKALSMKFKLTGLYSFYEVSSAMKEILPEVNTLYSKDPKLRTPAQSQLVGLYVKIMRYFEIARSLSLLKSNFQMPTESVAKQLDIPFGKRLNYIDLYKRQNKIRLVADDINKATASDLSMDEKYLVFLRKRMVQIEADQNALILKVVPPQFSNKIESDWYSPWQTLLEGKGSPLTVKFFDLWSQLNDAYNDKNPTSWTALSTQILEHSQKMGKSRVDSTKLNWESNYNKWDLFTKAITFYILGFLLLSFSWLGKGSLLQKLSFLSLCIGFIPHFFGLVLRCYIMDRPPVSTLYESVIFVGLVSVFSAIIYEKIKKNGIGVFIGLILGTFLLFVSFGYEKEGDSMGMLAAVLNTNFWLATHVVTITIGYGCSFVASVLGHVYLVQRYINKKTKTNRFDLISLNKSMNGATLYALFFVVLGTILGGIWADQSWGRFWGWDPKENGAMLICLWLLFVLHGRLAGFFKPKAYAVGLVFTSVIVAVAWFGVNLLNIGLHSYGFTDSIAYNLLYFGLFETVFVVVMLLLLAIFEKPKAMTA